MSNRYALVYTTYNWDDFTNQQYGRNASRCRTGDAHIAVDESNGSVAIPATYTKTVVSHEKADRLGLRIAYDRSLFWHNLDYIYYIFYAEHPQYEYYVFLDYDAVIDTDIDQMIDRMIAEDIDHIGEPLRDNLAEWIYTRQHRTIYGKQLAQGSLMSITLLSRRALRHLFDRRLEMSSSLPTNSFWPLCEAFLATELKSAGLKHVDLNSFGSVEHYGWWPPTLDQALAAKAYPRFTHPVLDRPRYIASMLKHSPGHHFIWPASFFWRAVFKCPDRRWIAPLAQEIRRRASRRLSSLLGRRKASEKSVGMRWVEAD